MVGWCKVIIMSNITEVKFGYVTLSYIITSGEGRGGVFKILHDYGGEGGGLKCPENGLRNKFIAP